MASCQHRRSYSTSDPDYKYCLDCFTEYFSGTIPFNIDKRTFECEAGHGEEFLYWPAWVGDKKSMTWARCRKCKEEMKV